MGKSDREKSALDIEFGNPLNNNSSSAHETADAKAMFEAEEAGRGSGGSSGDRSAEAAKAHKQQHGGGLFGTLDGMGHGLLDGVGGLVEGVGKSTMNGLGKLTHLGRKNKEELLIDARIPKANETFKRLFRMVDYNKDHSLRPGELQVGLEVLLQAWRAFLPLYPCSKVDFAGSRLMPAKQQAVYDKIMEELGGMVHEGDSRAFLLQKARDSGLPEDDILIDWSVMLTMIVEHEGSKEAKIQSLQKLSSSVLIKHATAVNLNIREEARSVSEDMWRELMVPAVAQRELEHEVQVAARDHAEHVVRQKLQKIVLEAGLVRSGAIPEELNELVMLSARADGAQPEHKKVIEGLKGLSDFELHDRASISNDRTIRLKSRTAKKGGEL